MLAELAPGPDEIVFPKTSSSVFISTNIDYVLRNLGVRYLIVAGGLTDQCVDSAVRDACDLGYLVTVPTDACATLSAERHDWSLRNNRGYCRQITTRDLLEEIARLTGKQ
jgi:ureidoacrylate peracid hydrolase